MPVTAAKKGENTEYFAILFRSTVESRSLSSRAKQFDCQQKIAGEQKRLFREFWQKLAPDLQPEEALPHKFRGFPFRPPAKMIPRFSCFRSDPPANIRHVERLEVLYGYYTHSEHYEAGGDVVSEAWRTAVETADPGVHYFYPHELRFKSTTLQYYLFLHGAQSASVDFDKSDSIASSVPNVYYLGEQPSHIALRRSLLSPTAYQHVFGGTRTFPLVNATLAAHLRFLLPKNQHLLPVSIVD